MCTSGRFMLMYGKTHYNIVIIFQLKLINFKKEKKKAVTPSSIEITKAQPFLERRAQAGRKIQDEDLSVGLNMHFSIVLIHISKAFWCIKLHLLLSRFSRVRLCATPQTAARRSTPVRGWKDSCFQFGESQVEEEKQSQGERGLREWLCLRLGQCISPEQGMCPRWSGMALLRKRIWPLMILPTGSFSSVSKHAPKCLILKKFPRRPRGDHAN